MQLKVCCRDRTYYSSTVALRETESNADNKNIAAEHSMNSYLDKHSFMLTTVETPTLNALYLR